MLQLIFLFMLNYSMALPPRAAVGSSEGYAEVGRILRAGITKDSQIKACDDFYEYACGGYIKDNPGTSRTEDFQYEMHVQLTRLLESNETVEGMPANGVLHILRETYRQCKQVKQDNSEWAAEVEQMINGLGGIPMFTTGQPCTDNTTQFAQFLAKTHKMNLLYYNPAAEAAPAIFTPLLQMTSGLIPKNIIHVQMQALVVPNNSKLTTDEKFSLFELYLKKYRLGLNQETDLSSYEQSIQAIVNFDNELLYEDKHPDSLTEITYGTLKDWLKSAIDVKEYFKTLLPVKKDYLENNPKSKIRTYDPIYFSHKISEVFGKYQDSCVKYNYVLYKLIEGSYLVHQDAKKYCIGELSRSPLKQALTALYIHTKQKSRIPGLKDMAERIKTAIQSMIKDSKWISEESTRKSALEKAMKMSMSIGGSNLFHYEELLADFYANFPFDSSRNYFGNRREMAKWFMNRMMGRIGISDPMCVMDAWYKNYALDVNAYYKADTNQIIINPGISQPPFYQENYPMFYKYGILGNVIGHEMTHGFDAAGRKVDASGTWKDWYDASTDREFSERAKCLVDQYDRAYMDDFQTPRGEDKQNEDIADNGGIRAAFKAYKLWIDKVNGNVPEKRLPIAELHGLTPDQLFFISAAQFYCIDESEDEIKDQIEYSDHSPHKYRVNMPLKNFAAFSTAFECGKTSKMNPPAKCIIW